MSEVLTQAAPVTERRICQPFRPREPGCGIFDATCAASVAGHARLGPPCFHGVRTQVRRGDGGGHPGPDWYRRCLSGPFSALPRSPGYGPVQRTPIGVRQARKTRRDDELGDNARILIETLHREPSLDGLYANIRVVNRDPRTGDRKGHQGALSVVFHAIDSRTGRPVALKFFDPDLLGFGARYRMDLFDRECKLLERLVSKLRCLQLVQPLSELRLSIPGGSRGRSTTIVCGYCVLEWLDGDLTEYFLRQDRYDALVKLALFRQAVLGVFALHREGIAHRDIKHDNLRRTQRMNREMVVPIDLGTAVDLLSDPIGGVRDYADPVGAWAFSPPEAHGGLGSIRALAAYTDIYALGCLLHDLFNVELYAARLVKDPGFNNCYMACRVHMDAVRSRTASPEDLVREWDDIMARTKGQVMLPPIDSATTTVPPAVRDQLDALLHRLTDADYRNREHRPDRIVRTIDAATRALENRFTNERRQAERAERRRRREHRARRQQERLDFYLKKKQEGVPSS